MIVSKPVVSSIRSRHTGQVGSSTSAGVGGARGFEDNVACVVDDTPCREVVWVFGESAPDSGEKPDRDPGSATWISTDLTKTTWHVSG